MKRTDKFIPVITVVVYYGEKPWDGATSLHEMLDIPDQMSAFVNDYRVFLIEARKNDLVFHNHDNADLFQLLNILLKTDIPKKEARQKAIQYSEEHNTDSSVIMTVAGATGSNIDLDKFEKGDMRMCTFVEEIRKEGREEGIKEGRAEEIIETGYEFGLGESEILKRLQHKLNISMQAAQEYLCEYAK